MSRRSTRIKQLHEEKPAITQPRPTKRARSVATGTAEPDAGAPHRKRSRTKKSTPTRVRKAGNFRQMLDMPLDVILEVSCTRSPALSNNHSANMHHTIYLLTDMCLFAPHWCSSVVKNIERFARVFPEPWLDIDMEGCNVQPPWPSALSRWSERACVHQPDVQSTMSCELERS